MSHRLDTRDDLPHLLNDLGLRGHGIEVGVYRGEYSKVLAERWEGEKLWLVDPWTHFDPVPAEAEWWKYPPTYLERPWNPSTDRTDRAGRNRSDKEHRANMATTRDHVGRYLTNKVEMKRMTSEQAALWVDDDSLSFVYLDGNHTYEAVRQDIHCWYRKIKPGGIIGGHDYSDAIPWSYRGAWNRVKEAVDLYADKLGWELFFTDQPSAHAEGHVGTVSWFAVKA